MLTVDKTQTTDPLVRQFLLFLHNISKKWKELAIENDKSIIPVFPTEAAGETFETNKVFDMRPGDE